MSRQEIEDRIKVLRAEMARVPVDKTITKAAKNLALEVRRLESAIYSQAIHS